MSERRTDAARIVVTTFGSLGDLHPYLALALEFKQRGHRPVIATSEVHRARVEGAGIEFGAVRPDQPDKAADPDFFRRIMDLRQGPRRVICEYVMPALRDSYDDLTFVARETDLLVSHPLTFMTRLVAEKQGIPWISSVLAPMGFMSVYDPPLLAPVPFLSKTRALGPMVYGPLFGLARWGLCGWSTPWHELRAELGLPRAADPLFAGQHSPRLVLALYSSVLGKAQRDWPTNTRITGFPFYDEGGAAGLSRELAQFLEEGSPPLVFTLGSAAVNDAGSFYEESLEAARLVGRRAALLVGRENQGIERRVTAEAAVCDYAPFAALFPRAAAIVHSGGIGTTAQALRSGRPMVVMPYAFDQPDNADRVVRLGVARTITRRKYSARRAAGEIEKLLTDSRYEKRAAEVGERIRGEDGARAACDAVEEILRQVKQ